MNRNWRRIATTLGFVSCLAMVAPACIVRGGGRVRVKPVSVVDEAPPKPKYRKVKPRPGYVWIKGRYEYRSGRWVWKPGHWKRARAGYRWKHGKWVRRGNRWHWTEGRWVRARAVVRKPKRPRTKPARTTPPRRSGPEVRDHRRKKPAGTPGAYPTSPPPAPRAEKPGNRPGFVWIPGHYRWKNGEWDWLPGHWKRARSGHRWKAGRWVKRGNRYVWVKGKWVKGVEVRDHRRKGR